jgi:hypothetical protein
LKRYILVIKISFLKSEKIEPLFLKPFNVARECLFKSDGSILSCKKWIQYFEDCQKDPQEFKEFLKAATAFQKQKVLFNFDYYRGYNNINV